MTKRLLAIGAVLAIAACQAAAESRLTGYIVRFGLYEAATTAQRVPDSGSPTGYVTKGPAVFQAEATTVPLVKGVGFGFDFRIEGVPADDPVRLTTLITHPAMRKPDGTVLRHQVFENDVKGKDGTITGSLWYTLREDYELLPGDWTLAVLQGQTVLVEKRFIVAAATAQP
jgi:hypothetical protein